ncbi:carotenoid biosynthesis protein [Thalassobacillus hwangdonensis]|uniref:Carotenoid biosynthesis protein n=1 Tax=Thalassobacillus hwangdonensis TaxID=546108 RepID=A0ABW3KYV1_9BACI
MTEWIYKGFIFWYLCGVILLTFDLLPPFLEWANAVFLILAGTLAVIYFIKSYGKWIGFTYSLIIFYLSIYVEHLGVEYDFLFGSYHYTDNFGMMIFGVPITIGFAWLLIMGCSHELARGITSQMPERAKPIIFVLIGSLIAVTMDLILDPVSYLIKEYWIWHDSGLYYGIPFSNFSGWFWLAALLHALFFLLRKIKKGPSLDTQWQFRMGYLFLAINGMFCLIALTGGLVGAVLLVVGLSILWYFLYLKWR